MRILIITQKVDERAPILGFFVRWLREFSKNCDNVIVLTQLKGTYELPSNVQVYSMGKEEKRGTIMQIVRCWKLAWDLRASYDVVFVHMTPIWVVLNGLLWKMLHKPIFLWYESPGRRWPLKVALLFVRKIFSATSLKLATHEDKNIVMNHGVDIDYWKTNDKRDPELLVTMGRVSQIKRVDLIIQCFAALPSNYRLMIIGGPFVESDLPYYMKIEQMICNLQLYDRVSMHFLDSDHARTMINRAQLFLHTSAGSLDKSLLQAMAAGTLVVSCSETAQIFLPDRSKATPDTFTQAVQQILQHKEEHDALRTELREIVSKDHALSSLIRRLIGEMSKSNFHVSLQFSSALFFCLFLASCTVKAAAIQ